MSDDTDIPQRYIDFCKAVGRLAREQKLRNLTMQFNPSFDDIWREQVEMSWASGRHYADASKVSITSTRRLQTTVDAESQQSTDLLEQQKEIAERIVAECTDGLGHMSPVRITTAIQAALAERDRAAKICDTGAMLASPVGVIPAGDPEHERLQSLANVLKKAAAAIRGSKQ